MSERRSFGTVISGNRQRNHEFNSEQKSAMVALLDAGLSARKVAQQFGTTHPVVTRAAKRFWEHNTLKNKPRSGRPQILSAQKKRYILRAAKSDRRITYDALCNVATSHVSSHTIRRFIRKHWCRKWKSLKRPKLTKETARERLHFCYAWLPNAEDLIKVRALAQASSISY